MKGRTTSAPKKVEKSADKSAKTSIDVTSAIASDGTAEVTGSAKASPSHEQISLRAYEIYLARGSEPGHEAEDWLTAESELTH